MIVAANAAPLYVPPSSRQDDVARAGDADPRDKKDDKRVDPSRPEFAVMLALLAATSPEVRADALKKLPPEAASLVDRLLNGGGEGTDASLVSDEQPAHALSRSQLLATAQATMSAVDSMRYGLIQDDTQRSSAGLTEQMLRSTLSGDGGPRFGARADTEQSADNIALSAAKRTLARIAGKRGVSQEQLLALGDLDGARANGQLNVLLSHAGTPEAAALADRVAQAAALAAATAASAADVSTPIRDTNALAPELRARLDRVISRMRDEYGSDVSVVETARSQQRQDYLFAQGRTREGAVVTWTHDSAHTRGEAVDVLVDGKWNNAEGFARLQRIAREEGLRTLGLKDPGHLELPRNGAAPDPAAAIANLIERRAASATTTASQPGIASVASVANVASVASVARVGEGSAPAADANAATPNAITAAYSAANANGRGTTARDERGSQGQSNEKNERANASVSERTPSRNHTDSTAAERAYAATTTAPTTAASGTHAATATTATSSGISTAERVADVQQLKADAPSGSLSRMTLEVDGANGSQRITVDLRGNVVDTQISTDAASAERLRMHTAELQDALGRHGLAADSVSISSNSRNEAVSTRGLVVEREGIVMTQGTSAGNGADAQTSGQSTRDRAMAREWDKNEEARKARDEQRQNAERQNAERQNAERQNAGQRGQRGTYNEGAR